MPNSAAVVYRLDARDEICYVNTAYDEFASANDGAAILSAAVLNRPVWDFVADGGTQHLYQIILRHVRQGRRVHFGFRCDAPGVRRHMGMDIAHVGSGTVELRAQTVAEEPRAPQPLLEPGASRTDDHVRICGWCKKIDVGGRWAEVEEAIVCLGLFERPAMPALTHAICEDCYRSVLGSTT